MKKTRKTRLLSMLLCFAMILSMLPINAMAGSWNIGQRPQSTEYYKYKGVAKKSDTVPLDRVQVRDGLAYVDEPLQQYMLESFTDSEKKFIAYCADFGVLPQTAVSEGDSSLLYTLTAPEHGFSEDTAAKLRAIMLNSDLYLSLDEMRSNSGVSSLLEYEALAAVQIAVWKYTNGINPIANQGALSNANVTAYYKHLQSLAPIYPEDMAHIVITGIAMTPNGSNYDVTITYDIEGIGATDDIKNTFHPIVETTSGTVAYDTSPNVIKITGANIGINVTIKGTLEDADDVCLFLPGNTNATQTFVSVVTGMEVNTTVSVDIPAGLVPLTFYKDWKHAEDSAVLSNTYVTDYESMFRITYAKGDFAGLTVTEEAISGNGEIVTSAMFEAGKLYKIEEISAENATGPAPVKYFTVDAGEIVWTDEDGSTLAGADLDRFVNIDDGGDEPGSVKISNTVEVDSDLPDEVRTGAKNEDFTFIIKYNDGDGVSDTAYADETYTVYDKVTNELIYTDTTNGSGEFTLNDGEYAVFDGIPEGWIITVIEKSDEVSEHYNVSPSITPTVTIADGGTAVIDYINTLKIGNLTIVKEFDASDLDWDDFDEIEFTISADAGNRYSYSPTVMLTSEDPISITLPLGSYTVAEADTDKKTRDGYSYRLEVEVEADGAASESASTTADFAADESVTVTFTNTYTMESGGLKVSSSVNTDDSLLTDDQIGAIESYSEVIVITPPGLEEPTPTVLLDGTDNYTGTELPTGEYTIVIPPGADIVGVEVEVTVTVNDEPIDLDTCDQDEDGNYIVTVEVEDGNTPEVVVEYTYTRELGSLTVKKAILGDRDANGNYKNLKTAFANEEFTFTLKDNNGNSLKDDNGDAIVYTLSRSNNWSVTIENLPSGTYTVTETNLPDRYDLVAHYYIYSATTYSADGEDNKDNASVSKNDAAEVTITNWYTLNDGIVLFSKTVSGTDYPTDNTFTFAVTVDGEAYVGPYTISRQDGTYDSYETDDNCYITGVTATDTVTIPGLPVEAEVVITEITAANLNYTLIDISGVPAANKNVITGTATVTASKTPGTVTFKNERNTVALTVSKAFEDYNNGNAIAMTPTDAVTVTIEGPADWAGQNAGTMGLSTLVSSGTTDTYSFELTSTSYEKEFNSIPAGTYTVTETVTDVTGYKFLKAEYVLNTEDTMSGTECTEDLTDDSNTITFTNTYYQSGSLEVEKEVENNTGTANPEFSATVNFSPAIPAGATIEIDNGGEETLTDPLSSTSITLTDGNSVIITGIPEGTECTVEEDNANGYTTSYSTNAEATIVADGTQTVTVTNTRDTGTLTISKSLDGIDWNNLYSGAITFTITGPTGWNGAGLSTTSTSGVYTFSLTGTPSFIVLSGLPTGNYTVNESSGYDSLINTDYYYSGKSVKINNTASNNGNVTLTAGGATVAFTNYYDYDEPYYPDYVEACLTVIKEFDVESDLDSDDFNGITIAVNGNNETLDASTSWKWTDTIGDWESVYEYYTLEEIDADVEGYIRTTTVKEDNNTAESGDSMEVSISSYDDKIVTFTNKYERIMLEVTKEVTDPIYEPSWLSFAAPTSFTFTLYKVVGSNATAVNGAKYYTVDSSGTLSEPTTTSSNGTFTLASGKTAQFVGLDVGAVYYVEESNNNVLGYTCTTTYSGTNITDSSTAADVKETAANTGTVPEITVTNTYACETGSLEVTNEVDVSNLSVSGNDYSNGLLEDKEFTFTLYYGDPDSDGTPVTNQEYTYTITSDESNTRSTNNIGKFTLRGGETATFESLPIGEYYVVEDTTDNDVTGYEWMEPGNADITKSGTVVIDGSSSIPFINEYTTDYGTLTVENKVEGDHDDQTTFEIHVTFSDNDGNAVKLSDLTSIEVSSGTIDTESNSIILYLLDEESAEITGIPDGLSYTVSENLTGREYYDVSIIDETGTIGTDSTCSVTNTRQEGDLLITKKVISTGDVSNESFIVEVTFTNPDGSTYNKTDEYTISNGDTITISPIPVGTHYTIEETDTGGMTHWISNSEGTIIRRKTIGKDIVNSTSATVYNFDLKDGDIALMKNVDAAAGSDLFNMLFTFKLTLSAPMGEDASPYSLQELKEQINKTTALAAAIQAELDNLEAPDYYGPETDPESVGISAALNILRESIDENSNLTAEALGAYKTTLNGNYDALVDILNDLDAGTYVTYDDESENGCIRITGTYDVSTPYILEEDQIRTEGSFESGEDDEYIFTLKHDQSIIISGLPEGTMYEFTEVTPSGPDGEEYLGITITINDSSSNGLTAAGTVDYSVEGGNGDVIIYENKFKHAKGSLTVDKVWANDNQGADSVTVTLYKVGAGIGETVILNADNNWTHIFTDLELGSAYRIVETAVSGYNTTYSSDSVTPTYDDRDVTITVTNTVKTPSGDDPDDGGDPDPGISPYLPAPTSPINPSTLDPKNPLRFNSKIPIEFVPLGWTQIYGVDEDGFEYWELALIPSESEQNNTSGTTSESKQNNASESKQNSTSESGLDKDQLPQTGVITIGALLGPLGLLLLLSGVMMMPKPRRRGRGKK